MRATMNNEQRTNEYLKKFDRRKVLEFLIKDKKPIIFDIGANVGSSLDEFKSWWPDAVVHCFEPQKECWNELDERAGNYSFDSVVVNKVGAGAIESKGCTFYTHDITTGQSGFHRVNTSSRDSIRLKQLGNSEQLLADYEASLNHARTVPLIRLDNYIARSKIQKVNLLKIDTQGYEPEVLAGLGEQLCGIDVVITELMFYDFYERSLSFSSIEKYLLPAGFNLYDISHISKNPMNGRTDWADIIYVNSKLKF